MNSLTYAAWESPSFWSEDLREHKALRKPSVTQHCKPVGLERRQPLQHWTPAQFEREAFLEAVLDSVIAVGTITCGAEVGGTPPEFTHRRSIGKRPD